HAAVWTVAQVDSAEPGVGGEEHVGVMVSHVAASLALELFIVDAPTVQVERKQPAAVIGGPLLGQIDHRTAVGMAAAAPVVFAGYLARVSPILARVPVP